MIPEFPIFMLAAARLGACFTVIFSGFSADSLADRLVDADAKLLVTAAGGRRRGDLFQLDEAPSAPAAVSPGPAPGNAVRTSAARRPGTADRTAPRSSEP